MTTLYRPVLIESAEQAAQMPVGTLARNDYADPLEKWETTYGDTHWGDAGDGLTDADMVGWTALVPIEAEEETARDISPEVGAYGPDDEIPERYLGPPRTRLVTPWEPA